MLLWYCPIALIIPSTTKFALLTKRHMPLTLLGRRLTLRIGNRPKVSEMPLCIPTPPPSLRIRLAHHLEKVVVLFILLPERIGRESMLFCPVRSAIVFRHDVGKFVEYLLVGNRFPIRSRRDMFRSTFRSPWKNRGTSLPVLHDTDICRLTTVAR